MDHTHNERKTKTANHIHRIIGQLNTLQTYIEQNKPCEDIAMLTTSIANSFDTLRVRTLEGFILNNIVTDKTDTVKIAELSKLLKLYKKI